MSSHLKGPIISYASAGISEKMADLQKLDSADGGLPIIALTGNAGFSLLGLLQLNLAIQEYGTVWE